MTNIITISDRASFHRMIDSTYEAYNFNSIEGINNFLANNDIPIDAIAIEGKTRIVADQQPYIPEEISII